MPRGFISRGYADIFGYIYIIVETRRPNQRVLLFERKKRVSVETLFKTQYTRSTLAELQGLGAAPAKHLVIPSLST